MYKKFKLIFPSPKVFKQPSGNPRLLDWKYCFRCWWYKCRRGSFEVCESIQFSTLSKIISQTCWTWCFTWDLKLFRRFFKQFQTKCCCRRRDVWVVGCVEWFSIRLCTWTTFFRSIHEHSTQWRNFHVAKGANAGQIFLTAPFAPSKKFKIWIENHK